MANWGRRFTSQLCTDVSEQGLICSENIEIQQIEKILSTDWQTGDWVTVGYNCDWYPGIIQDVRRFKK